jgi:hypothetical protein
MADPLTTGQSLTADVPSVPVTPAARVVADTAEDAIRRQFYKLAPGYDPAAPLPPSIGEIMKTSMIARQTRSDPSDFAQADPDPLDLLLAKNAIHAVPSTRMPGVIGPAGDSPQVGTYWEGIKAGLAETPLGVAFDHFRFKAMAESALGEMKPDPNYDPFADPQIERAGLKGSMALFYDSVSPVETLKRIMQTTEKQNRQAMTAAGGDLVGAGALTGQLLDPLGFVGQASSVVRFAGRPVWGALATGVKSAAVNAGVVLAAEIAKSEMEPGYDPGGVLDAFELPAALGFGAGVIRAATSRVPGASRSRSASPNERLPAALDTPLKVLDVVEDGIKLPADPLESEYTGIVRGLSSNVSPGLAASQLPQLLNQESLKATGIGLEKLPLNPAMRLLQSSSLYARQLATRMVDLGGMKQVKNVADKLGMSDKTSVPVEADIAREWKLKALQARADIHAAWVEARTGEAKDMSGAASTAMRLQLRDTFVRDGKLTLGQFDERIAKAARRGDKDPISDHYTPFVERAAASHRAFEESLRLAAEHPEVDLFGKANRRGIEVLQRKIGGMIARGASPEEIGAAKSQLSKAVAYEAVRGDVRLWQDHLDRLKAGGATPADITQAEAHLAHAKDEKQLSENKTAQSYFGRLWNQEALIKKQREFIDIVSDYFESKGIASKEARASAEAVHETLTRTAYRTISEAGEDFMNHVGDPGSAKMRSLEIPDVLIEDFLENSALLSVQHKTATLAPAIEMTRRFGDSSMERQIAIIKEDYKAAHAAETDPIKKAALNTQQMRDIEDVQALRDRLLNVAGASKDPHSWDQRTIRMLKHYMVWTNMGGSAISQLGDLFRPALTEGLDAMHRFGFKTLIDGSRKAIFEMSQRERMLAGDANEIVMGAHALSMSDIGDTFSSRSSLERSANKLTGMHYMLNGMNHATELTKKWAGVIVQANLNEAISTWANHLAGKGAAPDALIMERLRALSIDGNDAMRIHAMLEQHGAQFKSLRLANTEAWTDAPMADLYRQMLYRAIQRTVITPGAGDRPIWMTKPMGALIAQFRTFNMSSTIRTTISGMQDRDRNFWIGAATLTGSGILLNELRKAVFYPDAKRDQPYLGILADGIDRGGVLGSFMDVNNALEAASNNRLGMRPQLGVASKYPVTPDRLANAFFGPSAGKSLAAADALGRVVNGDFTASTWRKMRQFVPEQNNPVADPVFDAVFPHAAPGRHPK